MSDATPLISVVIPTHNRREMLLDALATVFAQSYRNFEIIVVDDHSTDGTADLLEQQYADTVRLVRRTGRSNAAAARNAGLKLVRGEYVAFLDSDDWWYPRKLEIMLAEMQAGGEAVSLVGGACEHVSADGATVLQTVRPPKSATYEDFCIKMWLPGSMSNNLIRASSLLRIGGFDERLTRAEDKDLFIRVLRGYSVRYTPEVTARVRMHPEVRKGMSHELAFNCRRLVDRKILEAGLRRRASAWTYFSFFERYWPSHPAKALSLLLRSFLSWPLRVHPALSRLRPAVRVLAFGRR